MTSTMTNCDDLPDLVSSDEETPPTPKRSNADVVEKWITVTAACSNYHAEIKPYVLGPFLFGIDNHVHRPWVVALRSVGLLVNKNREKDVTPLSKEEWEMAHFVAELFEIVADKLADNYLLIDALNLIDYIEGQLDHLSVKEAVKIGKKCPIINNIWSDISSKAKFRKAEERTLFCLLYIFKNYHDHLVVYSRGYVLLFNKLKRQWMIERNTSEEEVDSLKDKGNSDFKSKKFDSAIRLYTQAVKKDPLNHICYSNRCQAYLKISKYREALCDSLRSITIDRKWAKGWYRYAEALFELGMLDKALHINILGRKMCEGNKDLKYLTQLCDQHAKLTEEKEKLIKLDKEGGSKKRDPPDLVSDSSDDSDSENVMPGLITDSDNSHPLVKISKLKKKKDGNKRILHEYKEMMSEGSNAVVKGLFTIAASHFQKALETHTHSDFIRTQVEPIDVVILKYSYGIASVLTVQFKMLPRSHPRKVFPEQNTTLEQSIMAAIDVFTSIVEGDIKFPVAYYGLGKAYVTLNRFSQAVKPIKCGLMMLKNRVKCGPHHWPGMDVFIPETKQSQFEMFLKELQHVCRYPPTPDAFCRFHRTEDGARRFIYFNDPDFKGFIRVLCHELCVVEFHTNCWKKFKVRFGEKASDKDLLDGPCPTPDCHAAIVKILVFRHDNNPKEFVSDKPLPRQKKIKNNSSKTKLSNATKIARRAEKKEIRKQKRQEARLRREQEEMVKVEDNLNNSGNHYINELPSTPVTPEVNIEDLKKASTKLKKEDEPIPSYKTKAKKSKKKKEKSRNILTVEVNFGDHKETQLESEFTLTEEKSGSRKQPLLDVNNPFSIPISLQDQLSAFHSQHQEDLTIQNDSVAQNLFVYFEELLGEHGPLEFDSPVFVRELEDFPEEAKNIIEKCNGLRGFFQKSHKFGIMDNYVCVLKDCGKVRQLSSSNTGIPEYPALVSTDIHAHAFLESSSSGSSDALNTSGGLGSRGSNSVLDPHGFSGSNETVNSVGGVGSRGSSSVLDPHGFSGSNETVNAVGGIGSSQLDNYEFHLSQIDRKEKLDDISVSPVTVIPSKLQPIKPLVPLSKLKNTPKPLTFIPKTLPSLTNSKPAVKTHLNPAADEFKPFKSDSDVNVNESVNSNNGARPKTSDYNSLDDFSVPISMVSKTGSKENSKSISPDMDDIDDVQLYDSEQTVKHTNSEMFDDSRQRTRVDSVTNYNVQLEVKQRTGQSWNDCENWDDVDDVSDTSSMKEMGKLCELEATRAGSVYSSGNSRMDEVQPSRSSSRSSSHSELNSDLLYRTPSPALQPAKSSEVYRTNSSAFPTAKSSQHSRTNSPAKLNYTLSNKEISPLFSSDYQSKSPSDISEFGQIHSTKINSVSPYVIDIKTSDESEKNTKTNSPVTLPENSYRLPPKTSSNSPLLQNPLLQTKRLPQGFPNPPYPLPNPNYSFNETGKGISPDLAVKGLVDSYIGLDITNQSHNPWKTNPVTSNQNVKSFIHTGNTSIPGSGKTNISSLWSTEEGENVMSKNLSYEQSYLYQSSLGSYGNSYSGFSNGQWSKEKLTNEAETQTEMGVMSVGTSTDLNLDMLISHGKNLQDNNELLFAKLKQTEDEKTHLHAVGQQWLMEKTSLEEQFSSANQKIGQVEQQTVFLHKEIEQLKNELKMQKENNETVLRQLQEERNLVEEKQKQVTYELERAQKSEIEIVKLRLQLGLQQIGQVKREASFHQHNINAFAAKCQKENQELPPQTKQALAHWKKVMAKCELKITQLKTEYEKQIAQIETGTPLKDLVPVSISPVNQSPNEMSGMMFGPHGPQQNSLPSPPVQQSSVPFPTAGDLPAQNPPTPIRPMTKSLPHQPKPLIPPLGISRSFMKTRIPITASQSQGALQRPALLPTPTPSAVAAPHTMKPLVPPQQASKNSFEKLISVLQGLFPNYNRNQFVTYIQELRQACGGSLSGMSLDEIVRHVTDTIMSQDGIRATSTVSNGIDTASIPKPPGLSTNWSYSNTQPQTEIFREEKDPCVICHEELSTSDVVTLECKHRFHYSCVRTWFREQSTCPNCRVYALLPDDFPSLK